jgi:hypothetical protein
MVKLSIATARALKRIPELQKAADAERLAEEEEAREVEEAQRILDYMQRTARRGG